MWIHQNNVGENSKTTYVCMDALSQVNEIPAKNARKIPFCWRFEHDLSTNDSFNVSARLLLTLMRSHPKQQYNKLLLRQIGSDWRPVHDASQRTAFWIWKFEWLLWMCKVLTSCNMHIDNKKCRVVQDPMTFSVLLKCLSQIITKNKKKSSAQFFVATKNGFFFYFSFFRWFSCALHTTFFCLSMHPLCVCVCLCIPISATQTQTKTCGMQCVESSKFVFSFLFFKLQTTQRIFSFFYSALECFVL